eukprot:2202305-Rhodomonas_salina.2
MLAVIYASPASSCPPRSHTTIPPSLHPLSLSLSPASSISSPPPPPPVLTLARTDHTLLGTAEAAASPVLEYP